VSNRLKPELQLIYIFRFEEERISQGKFKKKNLLTKSKCPGNQIDFCVKSRNVELNSHLGWKITRIQKKEEKFYDER